MFHLTVCLIQPFFILITKSEKAPTTTAYYFWWSYNSGATRVY